MPLPNRLASVDIRTALETPQIPVSWVFQEDLHWYPGWVNHKLLRNAESFPVTDTDGTALFNEAYSANPRTSFTDIAMTADAYAYYAYYIEQTNYGHSGFTTTAINPMARQYTEMLGLGADRVVPVTAAERTRWSAGVNHNGDRVFNSMSIRDADNTVFNREVSMEEVLQENERIISIGDASDYGTSAKALSVITNQRLLVVDTSTIVDSGAAGVTGNDGGGLARRLTEAGQNFTETVQQYDILTIDDAIFAANNGEYTVSTVVSDTQIDVEEVFIGGALPNLDWRVSRHNPIITEALILWEVDMSTVCTAGFNVADGYAWWDANEFYFFVLDDSNQEVAIYDTAGPVSAQYDYSALSRVDDIHSIAFDEDGDNAGTSWICLAYHNHIMRFDPATAPWVDGDCENEWVTPYQIEPRALLVDTSVAVQDIWIVESDTKNMYHFTAALGTYDLDSYHMDWYENDEDTIALYHLEEDDLAANVLDSAGIANATNNGCIEENPGRWGVYYTRGYATTAVNQYVASGAATLAAFDFDKGSVEFHFKADLITDWAVGANQHMCVARNAAGHYINIQVSGNFINAVYHNGAASIATGATVDDTEWHHYKVSWDFAGGPWIRLYVDNVLMQSTAIAGLVIANPPTTLHTCGVANAFGPSMQGNYDEVRISDSSRISAHTYDTFWYKASELHEWSGRDYTTTPFEFRDQLFDDFMPDVTKLRDTNLVHWTPNQVLTQGEIVHRSGHTTPDAGQLHALLRLHGLLLDRLVDIRSRVSYDTDIDTVSNRHINKLSKLIGYGDVRNVVEPLTHFEIGMRRLRQITKGMVEVWKRKGSLNGMHLYNKLYHIALELDVLYYRRFWDSVSDPLRDDVYLDSQRLDSSAPYEPIGVIRVRAYYKDRTIDADNNGVTGAAATVTFNSAGAAWQTDAAYVTPGDMLCIKDTTLATQAANGQYRIITVPSGVQVTVENAWDAATGGLANLDFEIWKYLPAVDPVAEFVIDGLNLLTPFNMAVEYQAAM